MLSTADLSCYIHEDFINKFVQDLTGLQREREQGQGQEEAHNGPYSIALSDCDLRQGDKPLKVPSKGPTKGNNLIKYYKLIHLINQID